RPRRAPRGRRARRRGARGRPPERVRRAALGHRGGPQPAGRRRGGTPPGWRSARVRGLAATQRAGPDGQCCRVPGRGAQAAGVAGTGAYVVARGRHAARRRRAPGQAYRPAVPETLKPMRLVRLFLIVQVALRYGLDEFLLGHERVRGVRTLVGRILYRRDLREPRALRLRRALERLGPIFVKFGQVLSTRRDLLPADIADELARLQDRVPPFD